MNSFLAIFATSCVFLVVEGHHPEHVGEDKYAVVETGVDVTYLQAASLCKQHYGTTTELFVVHSPSDSAWLGQRINDEKNNQSGASKFWVGLETKSTSGNLLWVDGTPFVSNHLEVVKATGYEDPKKVYAWAVPAPGSKIVYEFHTPTDKAEAYICYYHN